MRFVELEILIRRKLGHRPTQEKDMWRERQKLGIQCEPRNSRAAGNRKLEEARKDPASEPQPC